MTGFWGSYRPLDRLGRPVRRGPLYRGLRPASTRKLCAYCGCVVRVNEPFSGPVDRAACEDCTPLVCILGAVL